MLMVAHGWASEAATHARARLHTGNARRGRAATGSVEVGKEGRGRLGPQPLPRRAPAISPSVRRPVSADHRRLQQGGQRRSFTYQ